jgi:hypothetical protein
MESVLPTSAPSASPSPSPATGSAKQSHKQQQQYCTNRGVDDRTEHSGAQVDAEPRQQPIADKRADDPDEKIANNSEPRPTNDFTGQPSGDDANEQYDQQALIGHMHWSPRSLGVRQID